ncbi:MAG: microviridin/marinostatin family tricyclic proteinase inhibitor [Alphaproteobacteria bacterium]|nr:microviridin/marinostatin family tricyclic proteinase inhibitor [Alphaproteobacteria bacterium]MCB9758200.1 microviridin/marinostatin family tricyclic proteinase inhibitor [Alphaproteobacteria bacterium]MCB9795107.1 microviridin/marinostatin family tricyclic proteinase inhibitor [Alphaproteobacteria bacterium]
MARKPFFMRFVETTPETTPEVRTDVKAGADADGPRKPWEKQPETMKWPSDGDDCVYW